jgi:methyl-accepting chemotaxis protein
MNINRTWQALSLDIKFTIVLCVLIAVFLTSMGTIVVLSRKNNQVKLTEDRMQSHVRDLVSILEIGNIARLEEKAHEIRYFENGYPVAIDSRGNVVVHPFEKGKNISGTALFARMQNIRNGQLSYTWPEQARDAQNRQIYFRYYEPLQLFVAASIDEDEVITKPVRAVRNLVLFSILGGLIVLFIVMRLLLIPIVKPIRNISEILSQLALGKQLKKIENDRLDEIGNITDSLNKLIDGLRETAIFANEIEKKNFNYPFTPLSKEDVLGKSLLDMRESLMKAAEEDEKRKVEDTKRNWTTEGLAKFSDILRQNNENLETLSSNVIKNLVKYLNINQGGIFVLNDENPSNPFLELKACYAFDRQKFLTKTIEIGEGITGTCFIEKETTYLKEIPDDYISITSGLGDAPPNTLLVVPLKLNEQVFGVIELASFNEFQPHEIAFVEKIGESIASTLSSVKTAMRTAELLEQSQRQREEMKAQEEEMRQNMEEMQSTQEELHRRNEEMKNMQQELDKESSLLRALLEYSEDTIYFKDKESKFLRVSRSLLNIWGLKEQKEALGISDFDLTTYEQAKPKFDAEQEIIKTGKPLKLEEQDIKSDGSVRWISTVKMPLYLQSGVVGGTFGISRDITEFRETLDKARQNEKDLKQSIEKINALEKKNSMLSDEIKKCKEKLDQKK